MLAQFPVRGRARRPFLLAFSMAMALAVVVAAPVAAATAGDDPADAIQITSDQFGTPQSYDTTGATSGSEDPGSCEGPFGTFDGPFTETVWHTFQADADGPLVVDVNSFPEGSPGFLAILFVFHDTGGGLEQIGCLAFPSNLVFTAEGGETYLAMTGSLPESPGGGAALITVATPLVGALSVDPDASLDPQDSTITVSGTVTCLAEGEVSFDVFASQRIGQATVQGSGFSGSFICAVGVNAWSVTLVADAGFFNPGMIDVVAHTFACEVVCAEIFESATVNARPSSNRPPPPPPPPPPAPDNDESVGAFPIDVGQTLEEETIGATASLTDPPECPAEETPASDHTVWFDLTVTEAGWVELNTIGSDYDTTLFVLEGGTVLACDDDIIPGIDQDSQLSFLAAVGTYQVMVGSFQGFPGGHLVLSALPGSEPPPPPPRPANDERANAVALAVGGSVAGDSSAATVNSATDLIACPGLPGLGHTVWYTVTPTEAGFLHVTLQAQFPGGVAVLLGDVVVSCQFGETSFNAEADTTYTIMVGSLSTLPGGTFQLSIAAVPFPVEITLVVDPVAALDTRTGEVTITGMVTCSSEVSLHGFVELTQGGGRFLARGNAEIGLIECGTEPVAWSVTLSGQTAKFQRGTANLFMVVGTGDPNDETVLEAELQLAPTGSVH